jgi:hypothetical protein
MTKLLSYQGLLDFSREFDVVLMDKVVTVFYTGAGQEVRLSVLVWAMAHAIVESTAANGTASFDSIRRTSGCLDEGARYLGAINISPVKGATWPAYFHFL